MEDEYISHTALSSGLRIGRDWPLLDVLDDLQWMEKLFVGDAKFRFGFRQYWF